MSVIGLLPRLGSQRREEDHLFDVVHAGEQHDEAVDADTEPSGRRHAVLEGAQVVLVDAAAFEVAGVACGLLLLEALPLLDRIVELAVAVGVLVAVDEQLEAIGELGIDGIDPRER